MTLAFHGLAAPTNADESRPLQKEAKRIVQQKPAKEAKEGHCKLRPVGWHCCGSYASAS